MPQPHEQGRWAVGWKLKLVTLPRGATSPASLNQTPGPCVEVPKCSEFNPLPQRRKWNGAREFTLSRTGTTYTRTQRTYVGQAQGKGSK